MTRTKFIESPQHRIQTEGIGPGRIICTYDGRLYWDTPGGVRIEITDIIELPNEAIRKALVNPIQRCYYVVSTEKLWRFHANKWTCINPDLDFIGNDGMIKIEYLPGMADPNGPPVNPNVPGDPGWVVILGPDGVVPVGHLPIATATRRGIATLGTIGGAARFGHKEDAGMNNVLNELQVRAADVQTTEPTAASTDVHITSARRIWTMLGGALSSLSTTSKTIVGSLNELFTRSENTNAAVALRATSNNPSFTGTVAMAAGSSLRHGTTTIIDTDGRVWTARYNDIAEWMPKANTTDKFEPGDVLAMGPTGVVRACSRMADLVIGVYSDTFGLHLGGKSDAVSPEVNYDTYVPVGLTGRVNVRVVGKVKLGDLLTVASDGLVGVAKVDNSAPRGTIIGKALEANESDGIKRVSMLIMNA